MKLTVKLILIFVLAIIVVTSLYAFIAIDRIEEQFRRDAASDAKRIGAAIEERITLVWSEDGEEGVLREIRDVSGKETGMRVSWVWLQRHNAYPRNDGSHTHYRTIQIDSTRSGALEMSASAIALARLEKDKWQAIYDVLLLSVAMVFVSGMIVALFGNRIVGQPLQQLIEKTRRIGHGDLAGSLQLQTRDELGELADSLNVMCRRLGASQEQLQEEAAARLAAVDQLRHADRLRTVGRLASGLAHELGTPLNVVAGRASLIASRKLSGDEIVDSAETIRAESNRMITIIRQLLDFARRSKPQPKATNLRQVILGTFDLLRAIAEKNNVQLRLDCEGKDYPIQLDVEQLQQVLSNLIVNAIQSMAAGGTVRVGLYKDSTIKRSDGIEQTGPYYCMTVTDEGVGILPEDLEHVFEPFFTTKKVGEGTGLGLSISYGIVQEHGGWLDVRSEVGRGSCFSVYLPMEVEVCQDAS